MTFEEELKEIADETKAKMDNAYMSIKTVPGQLDGDLTATLKDIWIERNDKVKAVRKKYGK